jgi:hypothetical protein
MVSDGSRLIKAIKRLAFRTFNNRKSSSLKLAIPYDTGPFGVGGGLEDHEQTCWTTADDATTCYIPTSRFTEEDHSQNVCDSVNVDRRGREREGRKVDAP